jgi:hypothetical protein
MTRTETARQLMLQVNRAANINGLNNPDWWSDEATRAEYQRIQRMAQRAYYARAEAEFAVGPNDRVYSNHDRVRLERAGDSLYQQAVVAWANWRPA